MTEYGDDRVVTAETLVDRAAGTATTTATANFSSLAAESVRRRGRLVSQSSFTVSEPVLYGYDALGRMISATDPRNGRATSVVYNAAGQQTSIEPPPTPGLRREGSRRDE